MFSTDNFNWSGNSPYIRRDVSFIFYISLSFLLLNCTIFSATKREKRNFDGNPFGKFTLRTSWFDAEAHEMLMGSHGRQRKENNIWKLVMYIYIYSTDQNSQNLDQNYKLRFDKRGIPGWHLVEHLEWS